MAVAGATMNSTADIGAIRWRGGTICADRPARHHLRMALLFPIGGANANVFLHSPRGSSNKLNEVSNSARNTLRLFDSQSDPNGGYQVGDNCDPTCSDAEGTYDSSMPGAGQGQMYFYEGSVLDIEWETQHGCGSANDNVHCTLVLQYMCEDLAPVLRDGSSTDRIPDTTAGASDRQYGMHEPVQYYQDCKARSRNKRLYSADQELRGAAWPALLQLTHTQRQSPNRDLTTRPPHDRRRLCGAHAAEPDGRAQRLRVPGRARLLSVSFIARGLPDALAAAHRS
jgi:hypothetical protein